MELTNKQQAIKDRRKQVCLSYEERGQMSVTLLVETLAKKLKVTTITIWNDLKELGLTKHTA